MVFDFILAQIGKKPLKADRHSEFNSVSFWQYWNEGVGAISRTKKILLTC